MTAHKVATGLYDVTHRLTRKLRNFRRDTSAVSGERLSAMLTLKNIGNSSIKELASSEQVAHSTMSRMVSGLRDKGLARVYVDESDRRTSSIQLTSKGVQVARSDLDQITHPLAAAIRRLPKRDQLILAQSIEILDDLLEAISG